MGHMGFHYNIPEAIVYLLKEGPPRQGRAGELFLDAEMFAGALPLAW